ncbi:hypothetical protein BT93_J1361 [Corymbia citriodora subsp. variegata]|nr:hypothetical protein BT93_J1361 [Corymbia citriodora subsp. variegata]
MHASFQQKEGHTNSNYKELHISPPRRRSYMHQSQNTMLSYSSIMIKHLKMSVI